MRLIPSDLTLGARDYPSHRSPISVMTVIPAATAPADLIGGSIVLVGQFEPLRAQPATLLREGLVDSADLAASSYEFLTKDFPLAILPWMVLTIELEKLTAMTTLQNPAVEPVRDFVLDFLEAMPQRRYTALGINWDNHIAVRSPEELQTLLDRVAAALAPFPIAEGNNGVSTESDPLVAKLLDPKLRSLVFQARRDDQVKGQLTIRIEPSTRVVPGIYLQINDHYEADPDTLAKQPDQLLGILSEGWERATQRADGIIAGVREELDAIA